MTSPRVVALLHFLYVCFLFAAKMSQTLAQNTNNQFQQNDELAMTVYFGNEESLQQLLSEIKLLRKYLEQSRNRPVQHYDFEDSNYPASKVYVRQLETLMEKLIENIDTNKNSFKDEIILELRHLASSQQQIVKQININQKLLEEKLSNHKSDILKELEKQQSLFQEKCLRQRLQGSDNKYSKNIKNKVDAQLGESCNEISKQSQINHPIQVEHALTNKVDDENFSKSQAITFDLNFPISQQKPLPVSPNAVKPSEISCTDAVNKNNAGRLEGVYSLQLPRESESFNVYCLPDSDGRTAWAVIQRRMDNTVNFQRDWNAYKNGFGNLSGNYFLGLEKIQKMRMNNSRTELWIQLSNAKGNTAKQIYSDFVIENEDLEYELKFVGNSRGSAGDSLSQHIGEKFMTAEQGDNNCASENRGAWWYTVSGKFCVMSDLNGVFGESISWFTWSDSITYAHMAIRNVPIDKIVFAAHS